MGIDVGAARLHVVVLTERGEVAAARSWAVADAGAVVASLGPTTHVAVDAPNGWSTGAHVEDEVLSPKFRAARCGEIGLGRQFGVWVPWVAPATAADAPPWMRVGVELCAGLRAAGHDVVETYPHAAFRVLGGGRRLPRKQTPAGRAARLDALEAAGLTGTGTRPLGDSHDLLDAAAAALVALHRLSAIATPATCGHDGTAIWLPSAAGVPEPAETAFGG